MKILVTGGNGFIGRRLINSLVEEGHHDIKVLSRNAENKFPAGVQVLQGDLTSKDCPFDKFMENGDIIFHCAGELYNIATMRALHVEGTEHLLQAALKEAHNKKRALHWVQLSSVGAYGYPLEYIHTERIVTEDTPTQPFGEYEITKTLSDELVLQAAKSDLLSYSIVRPSKVFGAGKFNPSLHSLGKMIRNGLFFYIGRPGAVATYVHVDDVVEVLKLCGTNARARGKVFNISNDCLLEEMINGIASSLEVSAPRLRFPERFVRNLASIMATIAHSPLTQEQINGLVRRTKYPYTRLKKELDYSPKISVPQVISETIFEK
ncbi:MAG: NAD-dependent epimerase [Deltaproteobacteria bacterium CG11_big_fil_rev_8_21_14_0_20_42_23]|nr:MAG: NAD-dependent epimerase [Deltaproteobacteria bacterium CG11_big_fil_rev_8_21_14_0_20_42_23]PJC64519.1 MAG: NAD(P)-dependent oxidoreductase [Deltaproteobacteria bacterium CG_4_9_14_0_2_um_filter_42_21]